MASKTTWLLAFAKTASLGFPETPVSSLELHQKTKTQRPRRLNIRIIHEFAIKRACLSNKQLIKGGRFPQKEKKTNLWPLAEQKNKRESRLHENVLKLELELGPMHIQMTQKPTERAEVYARALRASQVVKFEVWLEGLFVENVSTVLYRTKYQKINKSRILHWYIKLNSIFSSALNFAITTDVTAH